MFALRFNEKNRPILQNKSSHFDLTRKTSQFVKNKCSHFDLTRKKNNVVIWSLHFRRILLLRVTYRFNKITEKLYLPKKSLDFSDHHFVIQKALVSCRLEEFEKLTDFFRVFFSTATGHTKRALSVLA